MKQTLLILLLITSVLFAWRPAPEIVTDSYTGYAYGEGTEDLVYTEEFTDRFVDGKHLETFTDYFDPEHRKIARRILDFRKSRFAPDFRTEDLRSGYVEGAEIRLTESTENTEMPRARVRLYNRKDKNSNIEEKILEIPQPVVIDGGFNQFIKANWETLTNGGVIIFQFAVPARLDYFTLRASRVEANDTEMAIKVEPEKPVLRWLTSPIIVRYSKDTRRIKTYEGKSNISDEKGNNFVMRLVYPRKGP